MAKRGADRVLLFWLVDWGSRVMTERASARCCRGVRERGTHPATLRCSG